jgi:hypothetical protein
MLNIDSCEACFGMCARQRVFCLLWLDGLAGFRPGGRDTFLCFAKEKYPKERRAEFVGLSLRYRHAALLSLGGVSRELATLRHARPLIRPSLRYSPPHHGVGGRGQDCQDQKQKQNYQHPTSPITPLSSFPRRRESILSARLDSRLRGNDVREVLAVGICYLPPAPRRVTGLSSAAAGGSGLALSERSEFSQTPPAASSARHREAALSSARLSFGYFSLAKQRKVSRPPGRNPAKPSPRSTTQAAQQGTHSSINAC